ncbi:MAG TPA: alpha/beta hydrolase-fold protein [Bacteroidota bacterium]|nr:alpha/beta hydrolase-fold protein [Bacteroidota bacterium]
MPLKLSLVSALCIFSIPPSFSITPLQHKLIIKVVAPKSTPRNASVFVAGNGTALGGWDAGAAMMTRENDSTWSFHASFNEGSQLEFKITRGSWINEALYGHKTIPTNVVLVLKSDTVITLHPISWKDIDFPINEGITGTVKYLRGLRSPALRHPRDVIIWLPPSYEKNPSKKYPVLYMHDGQNIIDPLTSFGGLDWRVDEVADSLIEARSIEEIIIVGIYNTRDREQEYSDTPLGRAYADFVVHMVKPMIDSMYRTKPDKKNTAVMGSSSGGLISFLFAWWYPDIFSKAGCLSSAFLVDSNKIIKEVKAYAGPKKNIRIYLDNGSAGIDTLLKPGYDKMVRVLEEKGYVKGKDLEYFFDKGAEHNERAWARRVWRPLVFMFGK